MGQLDIDCSLHACKSEKYSRKTGPPRCSRWKKSMVTFYPQYLGVLNMKLGRRLTITKSSLSSRKQFLKLLAQSCNKNWFHIREWRTKLDEFGSRTSGLDAGPIPPNSSNTGRLIINLHGTSHLGAQCQDLQQVKAILTTTCNTKLLTSPCTSIKLPFWSSQVLQLLLLHWHSGPIIWGF
jgi:hypothetical protein